MRDPENVREVSGLKPDFMGYIFYPRSPRYCTSLPEDTVRSLPGGIMPVAVFVNNDFDGIMNIIKRYGFKGVQLHGEETPEMCRRLKDEGLFVLKAISVKDSESIGRACGYEGYVDLLVLDTATDGKGGSGRKFDWSLLNDAVIPTDFLLSGGIGPDDADDITNLDIPHMVGVDLNSRFEISPGVKSKPLLSKFFKRLNDK